MTETHTDLLPKGARAPLISRLLALATMLLLSTNAAAANGNGTVVLKQDADIPVLLCRALDLCVIQLHPGETLTDSFVLGDWSLWSVEARQSGSDTDQLVRLVIRPDEAATQTNLMISTNRGFHDIQLVRSDTEYTPVIGFTDPAEETLTLQPEEKVPLDTEASPCSSSGSLP